MSSRGERTYQEGNEQPNVGTDPMEAPQQDEKKQVAPDPEKMREAEQRSEGDETPVEEAEGGEGA